MRKSIAPSILVAGLVVGTADILSAFIYSYARSGVTPERVLRYIASGAFGKQAFTGGSSMIVWGLLFHYIIAFSFTLLFFLIYPKIKWIASHKIAAAVIYGVFMWAVTSQVVVPLSQIGRRPFNFTNSLINIAILIVAIGIPLVFLAHRYYSSKKIFR